MLESIPAAGFGWVCTWSGKKRQYHTGQNTSSLPPATMSLLLSVVGVALCSLVSSDVLPQAEFSLQMVSQKTVRSSS